MKAKKTRRITVPIVRPVHPGPLCECADCRFSNRAMAKKVKTSAPDLKDITPEWDKKRATRRTHLDAPPRGTAIDQTTGFHSVLVCLYMLEDEMAPVPPAIQRVFAVARATCERFLPAPLVQMLRNKHK